MAQEVLDALFGLGRLQGLVDDPEIENIDINGCDRVWVTYSDGSKVLMPPVAHSDDELVEMMRTAGTRFGLSERRFDLARPELDLQLPGGSRLSALMAVAARPAVSIRRHRYSDLSLDDLVVLGSVDRSLASLLAAAVRARKNIVVAGAMNSGKTTLLRLSPPRFHHENGSSPSSRPSSSVSIACLPGTPTWSRWKPDRRTSKAKA